MGGCFVTNSANQQTCLSSYPSPKIRYFVLFCDNLNGLGYGKRGTNLLFCFWLLAHKGSIPGWITAEMDSEIVLTVQDIY